MIQEEVISFIKLTVEKSAAASKENAALAGSWGDGGASQRLRELDLWLDGVKFAQTGSTVYYNSIVQQHLNTLDPEYQQYLRLKEKFKS